MKENVEDPRLFYRFKSVIGLNYSQIKRVPHSKPSKNAFKLH